MNSYFDHSTGFYNPAHHSVADPHQSAYRTFPHSLSLVPSTPQSAYQSSSRTNSSSAASDSSSNYVDAACKLYDPASLPSSQPPTASVFKSECSLSKEQNGFKAPDQMTAAWNSAASLRPSPSSGTGFDVNSRSVSDAWSACCQNTTPAFVDPYSSLRPFDGGDYHHHHHRYAGNSSTANGKAGRTVPTLRHLAHEGKLRAALPTFTTFPGERQKGTQLA